MRGKAAMVVIDGELRKLSCSTEGKGWKLVQEI